MDRPHHDVDLSLTGELAGVGEQVKHDLGEPLRIGAERRARVANSPGGAKRSRLDHGFDLDVFGGMPTQIVVGLWA